MWFRLPRAAAKGGLQREAYRQAPASTGEKAGGARDASIWLTTLEQCRVASPAKVYLVAADADFGSGCLRPELIDEAPPNLVYCHGVEKVLAELADPVDVPAGEPQAVLRTENVKQAVRQALTGPDVMYEIARAIPALTGTAVQSIGQTSIALERVPSPSKMHAYKAGDDLFVTAELEWRAQRQYVDITSGAADRPVFDVRFKVKTLVIVVLTDAGAIRALSVARRGPIFDVDWGLAGARFSAFAGLAST
jgi:hypothetical protein